MRFERLGRLFSVQRYRSCRSLFRAPLAAHLRLAGLGKGPIVLEDRAGGRVTCPSYRTVRRLWQFVLERPEGVALEDGCVVLPLEGGARVFVRPDNSDFGVFEEVFLNDAYGLDGARDLGDVVDLGGNVGLFTARAARVARRVVMVEPVPANLEVARRNIAGSGAGDRVTVVPGVVTATTGERVRLHLSEIAGMHSTRADVAQAYAGTSGALDVEGVSLGDLFARHGIERCALLKCDIEGAEHEVLAATPLDVLARIDRLVMEVHFTPRDGDAGARLVARLEEAGLATEVTEGTLDAPADGLSVALLRAARRAG